MRPAVTQCFHNVTDYVKPHSLLKNSIKIKNNNTINNNTNEQRNKHVKFSSGSLSSCSSISSCFETSSNQTAQQTLGSKTAQQTPQFASNSQQNPHAPPVLSSSIPKSNNKSSPFSCSQTSSQPQPISPSSNSIIINDTNTFDNFKKVHIFGFGKAVFGMADYLTKSLNDKSIPLGHVEVNCPIGTKIKPQPSFKVNLAAKNNLPDQASFEATQSILNAIVANVTSEDLVIVLISGGGSALSCCPTDGLTVHQKQLLIRQLSNKGATINELNTVRQCLSKVKGGALLHYFPEKSRVIGLILSDVIGSPVNIIASGLMAPFSADPEAAKQVLKKFGMPDIPALSEPSSRKTSRDSEVSLDSNNNSKIKNTKKPTEIIKTQIPSKLSEIETSKTTGWFYKNVEKT